MEIRSVKQGDAEAVADRARLVELRGGANGTDAALVVAAKAGDASAFGELYERYRDAIYRFCLARTGTAHDAGPHGGCLREGAPVDRPLPGPPAAGRGVPVP